jgi:hypothetical protein
MMSPVQIHPYKLSINAIHGLGELNRFGIFHGQHGQHEKQIKLNLLIPWQQIKHHDPCFMVRKAELKYTLKCFRCGFNQTQIIINGTRQNKGYISLFKFTA